MTLEILANAGVRMLVVGAIVWIALRALRVRNPHVETLVWRMVLLASLALPVLLIWRIAPAFATTLQLPVIAANAESGLSEVSTGAESAALPLVALSTIYLVVACLLLTRFVVGLAAVWRISRKALPLDTADDIRVSSAIHSPATFGSTILLPAGYREWPADKRETVLLHERAHVRGHDGHWSWLARVHTTLFWFSPFAWLLQRKLEALAETTSDDAVVAARRDPVAYAELLLDFARRPNSRSVVMSVADSNVTARIERLLAGVLPGAVLPRASRWAALVLMIPTAVLAATTTTRSAPPLERAIPRETTAPPVTNSVKIQGAPDPADFYPPVAKAEGAAGRVVVQVTVDPLGQVIDAVVVEPDPSEERYGFSAAALEVARRSRFSNSSQQTGSMRFMVRFSPPQANAPQAVRLVGAADPDAFYPPVAKAERVTGSVVVQVTVDPLGKVLEAVALESTPADPRFGFANAAIQVAQASRFKNSSREPASLKFMVKFALKE